MRNALRWLAPFVGLTLVCLLACCATASKPKPASQVRAIEINNRATAHYHRGEYAQALELFQHALLLEQAIEREEGMALNWYNLSLVYQRLGRVREAEQALDAVLLDRKRSYPARALATMTLRRAVLAAARNDWDGTQRWLLQADSSCGDPCALEGKILNLRAHVSMQRGHASEVLRTATAALAANRGDLAETANSLRLQASAHLALENWASAGVAAAAALDADKELGEGLKIYQDLLLLGHANRMAPALARDYWLRAGDVARATGDADAERHIEVLLGSLKPAPAVQTK